jgi:protein TonB
VIVPKVVGPEPPLDPVIVIVQPDEFKLERHAPEAPKPPKRGSDNPGPATAPPPEDPRPDVPPVETPSELPTPIEEIGDQGTGIGEKGVTDGASDGASDGTGTGDGPGGPGTGDGGGPQELTGDMVAPVLVQKVSPVYPSAARIGRIQGHVIVEAVIGLDGSVESAEILSSNPLFDAAALAAVRQWRYRPATMNGRPVRVYFKVQVGFVLR